MDVVVMCILPDADTATDHHASCLYAFLPLPVLLFCPKISLFHEKNPLFCLAGNLAGNPLNSLLNLTQKPRCIARNGKIPCKFPC
jgi:hypothetical protein